MPYAGSFYAPLEDDLEPVFLPVVGFSSSTDSFFCFNTFLGGGCSTPMSFFKCWPSIISLSQSFVEVLPCVSCVLDWYWSLFLNSFTFFFSYWPFFSIFFFTAFRDWIFIFYSLEASSASSSIISSWSLVSPKRRLFTSAYFSITFSASFSFFSFLSI